MKKQQGGKVIGSGGFGDVYDDVDDIGPVDSITYYDSTKTKSSYSQKSSKNLFENVVFKVIEYDSALKTEKINNKIIYKLFKDINKLSLTSLHNRILSVWNRYDEIVVYRKMKTSLVSYLYTPSKDTEKSYYKIWVPTKTSHDNNPEEFIYTTINNILRFCKTIHENNMIHKDIKIDNILIGHDNNDIVLADYGLLLPIEKDDTTPYDNFFGMSDYMPPFCHYVDNDRPYNENYKKRMLAIFFGNPEVASSQPRGSQLITEKHIDDIINSYDDKNLNKFKIDLHPIGIVLLQLCHRFKIEDDKYISFALKLMTNNTHGGFINAKDAYESWQTMKGGSKFINILGRNRKIQRIKGHDYIVYNKELITIKQARQKQQTK